MKIYKLPQLESFENHINGKNSHLFILENTTGMKIALTDYGARLVSVLVPDKKGDLVDVVLGFDSIKKYMDAKEQYHGATVGRVCNRIANGSFSLHDKQYKLTQNNRHNTLHGGKDGFHTKIWDRQLSFENRIDFYYISPDNEEGFPGEVKVNVSYELTNKNEIIIKFRALSNKDTVLNLTNHAYFNLNGEGSGDILGHLLHIDSKEFLPVDKNQIPLGYSSPVEKTTFDFTVPKRIGKDINAEEEQLKFTKGYDHSFVNNNPLSTPIATAYTEESGIQLQVLTDLPTLHLYTGNFLENDEGKSGNHYTNYGGFCLEAQHYIDSPNQKNFPKIELKANEEYRNTIVYKFSIIK